MCFTRFTVIQNGWTIGGFTAKEMAVSTAKQHAVDTGKPVTVVAHVAGGGSREAIFNSDGTIQLPLTSVEFHGCCMCLEGREGGKEGGRVRGREEQRDRETETKRRRWRAV